MMKVATILSAVFCAAALAGCAVPAGEAVAKADAPSMDLEARTGSNFLRKVQRKPGTAAEKPTERDMEILEKALNERETGVK